MRLIENNHFEDVLNRMLASVPSSLDKREGSVIYDALAPAALEVAVLYSYLDYLYEQSFAHTADREYLEKLVAPWITPYPATKAIVRAEFKDSAKNKFNIAIGSRFNLEKLNFVATRKIEDGVFALECEEAGMIGNVYEGDLTPIEYIQNLAQAKIVGLIERAFEAEETEHIRSRFLRKVREPATSGNIYHYKRWALEVEGVGDVKVFPLHAGAGTVKVLIINALKELADGGLITKAQKYIDEVRPIGATVTVATASEKNISVSARISKTVGADMERIKSAFRIVLKQYFKDITFRTDYLSIAKVGNILLQVDDVLDYSNLKLNQQSSNVAIHPEEILKLTNITLEEV